MQEVWPGSHLFTTIHDNEADPEPQMHITSEMVEARRKTNPPLQVPCKYGGVFLRDMRLWHAGTSILLYVTDVQLTCQQACPTAPPRTASCLLVAMQRDGTNVRGQSK